MLIDPARRLAQICDHEAGGVAGLSAHQAHDFGFDDHAAHVRPRAGGIGGLGVEVLGLSERELLRAMGRIVGGIAIDRDLPHAAMQTTTVACEDAGRQRAPHLEQHLAGRAVLEARDRRLRRQARADDRIAAEQQFMHRIVGQPIGIIRIGIAAGQSKDSLGQQILDGVPYFARLSIVDQAPREAVDQIVLALGGFQQDGPAVGTRVRLIEPGDEGTIEEVRKENSLWYRLGRQSQRLRCEESLCGNSFLSRGAFVLYESINVRELFGLAARTARSPIGHELATLSSFWHPLTLRGKATIGDCDRTGVLDHLHQVLLALPQNLWVQIGLEETVYLVFWPELPFSAPPEPRLDCDVHFRDRDPAEACGSCRTCGRSERAHKVLGKPHRARFPTATPGCSHFPFPRTTKGRQPKESLFGPQILRRRQIS